MKNHLITLSILLTATTTFAQGLVNFANTPTTAVLVEPEVFPPQPYTIMSGPAGSYYFELFFGTPIGNYTATGIYATNTGVDGLFSGGIVAVPNWPVGTSKSYWVAGWDAGMGHVFNPMWFNGTAGNFGTSNVGTGVAGDGNSIPVLNLFEGGSGTLTMGLELSNTLVPEPSTVALATLGAALVVIFGRSRKLKWRAFS